MYVYVYIFIYVYYIYIYIYYIKHREILHKQKQKYTNMQTRNVESINKTARCHSWKNLHASVCDMRELFSSSCVCPLVLFTIALKGFSIN